MFNADPATAASQRCVGETAFVAGIASASESGTYGSTKLCAAIVATCDMATLDPFEMCSVLDAHAAASPTRFKAIRAGWSLPITATCAFALNMALLEERGLVYELGASFDKVQEAMVVRRARARWMWLVDMMHLQGCLVG